MSAYIIIFGIYLIGILYVGYRGYTKTDSISDFHVAGHGLGLMLAVGTFGGSFVSAASIVGYIGSGWIHGYGIFTKFVVGCAIGWLLLQVVGPKLYRYARKHERFTLSDFFADRYYSKFMRAWTTFIVMLYCISLLVIQLKGVGTILDAVLGIPYVWGVIGISIVFIAYTTLGGMMAVAVTDLIQFVILVAVILIILPVLVGQAGGFAAMNATANSISPDLVDVWSGDYTPPLTSIGMMFTIAMAVVSSPYYLTRFYSCKSVKTARGMVGIGAVILIVWYIALVTEGVAARVLMPTIPGMDSDYAFPMMVKQFLSPVLGGFVLTALTAAIMSTTDSILLAVGSSAAQDIYRTFINVTATDKQMLRVARWVTGLTGVLAMILAIDPPGLIMQIYPIAVALLSSGIAPPLLVGLFWRKATKEGGIAGSIISFIITTVWQQMGNPFGLQAAMVGIPIGCLIIFIVSLMTKEPPKEAIEPFFTDESLEPASVN